MKNQTSIHHQTPPFGKQILADGTSKWTHRTYEINFSADGYVKANKQMKEQDERIDNIILLKVDYNIMAGKAIITDKICTFR